MLLDQNFFFTKLVAIYHRKIHWKNFDDFFLNEGDIELFEEKKTKNKNFNFGNLRMLIKNLNSDIIYMGL